MLNDKSLIKYDAKFSNDPLLLGIQKYEKWKKLSLEEKLY